MTGCNDKIIVRVANDQKNTFISDGIELLVPIRFENNYREKAPVIAQVVSTNEVVGEGDIILCHHNTFYLPSPYHLYDDLFSIPANGNIIFAKLNIHDGSLLPIYGNMICQTIDIQSDMYLPIAERKQHIDRIMVTDPGYCNYKEGQILFTRPHAAYQIVYNWQKQLIRVFKCPESQVCGVLTK